MEIERRIDLPGNRAAAAARAMFPQSRHPVRRGWGGRVVVVVVVGRCTSMP